MEPIARIPDLILKELKGEIDESELAELREWAAGDEEYRAFYAHFLSEEALRAEIIEFYSFRKNVYEKICRQIPELRPGAVRLWPGVVRSVLRMSWGYAAAVILLIMLVGGGFLWWRRSAGSGRPEESARSGSTRMASAAESILPGGNRATLVLEDGRAIGLDTVGAGTFTRQGNVKVVKLDSGKIAYTNVPDKAARVVYNTLTTPKGGQYGLVLPDGTRVWLNAASSLRFPTAFTGRERRVELTGEGYFEVAGDRARPFTVQARDGMEVEVLGTHFDIMAYEDEPAVRTSLLEGMVRVTEGGAGRLVRPGQQAEWRPGGEVVVHDVDVGDAVAWKNGFFQFHIASIEEVLRQLSRWYDIEIRFEGKKPEGHFEGEISRSNSLADVLRMLEVNGLRFRLEGRTLVVQ